jgi:tryptophan synthase alpha chain
MSRLQQLFLQKPARVLNVYCTAGFPTRESTLLVMQSLQKAGVDLIELGMPYSDPLADGPVIQHSSAVALSNGMTMALLFEQLKDMRATIQVPVILMGYMNPVLQYGFERFCSDAAAAGIDGLILPDLPAFEFETTYGAIVKKYGLDFIFLVTPETAPERVLQLDAVSSGFLYAVSSSSTTGSGKVNTGMESYLKHLQQLPLQNPVLVGFGIKDKTSFDAACAHAAGAIIGSAFIQKIDADGADEQTIREFVTAVLG